MAISEELIRELLVRSQGRDPVFLAAVLLEGAGAGEVALPTGTDAGISLSGATVGMVIAEGPPSGAKHCALVRLSADVVDAEGAIIPGATVTLAVGVDPAFASHTLVEGDTQASVLEILMDEWVTEFGGAYSIVDALVVEEDGTATLRTVAIAEGYAEDAGDTSWTLNDAQVYPYEPRPRYRVCLGTMIPDADGSAVWSVADDGIVDVSHPRHVRRVFPAGSSRMTVQRTDKSAGRSVVWLAACGDEQ